jgi:error-prone DNA polymerase
MGFYHPATLVKDAQRHGVRFAPIDVQVSDWECRVEDDGRVRLGLMYVNGLRKEIGRAIATANDPRRPDLAVRGSQVAAERSKAGVELALLSDRCCPKCGCDDASMLEETPTDGWFCNICAHEWGGVRSNVVDASSGTSSHEPRAANRGVRFDSIDDFVAVTKIRRDELATLAEIGALNAFGFDRRSALWQIEQAIRPAGELFAEDRATHSSFDRLTTTLSCGEGSVGPQALPEPSAFAEAPSSAEATEGKPAGKPSPEPRHNSPLRPMNPAERLMADYAGTSLTIGPHPMALRRAELALRGVLRATDLPRGRHGRRVRIAGAVITRQRPGTAKGFVFLTLEDETGIANIIVQPDLFSAYRSMIVGEPYLLIEGTLQIQEGVTSVKAEHVMPLATGGPDPKSHDFR